MAEYYLTTKDVLDGGCHGKLYVDDPNNPQSAFLYSRGWYGLAGNTTNDTFNQSLKAFLAGADFANDPCRNEPEVMFLYCHPLEWRDQFPILLGASSPIEILRRHYRFRQFPFDWRTRLPDGFVARPIDKDLLENNQLRNIRGVRNWMRECWTGAMDVFYQRGGGVCLLRGDEIVSWCLLVEIAGQSCELGVETTHKYRRLGFGALVTMAAVAACLERGFTVIDWHCNESNGGSWGLAEKSGFGLERKYTYHAYFFDQASYCAAIGELRLQEENYPSAAEWFEKAIATGHAKESVYHNAAEAYAVLGEKDAAIRYLNTAIDKGWDDIDFTQHCANLKELPDLPEWAALLARMPAKS